MDAATIFALSSGLPPAAIAIVRVSGPGALAALESLTGIRPEPRYAQLVALQQGSQLIDKSIIIHFAGPHSQTGEDIVEFHLHGGRAVVEALLAALGAMAGLRAAEPGEFTRRAFENGKIDLTGVEGLADLILAETEMQRRAALSLAEGQLSRRIGGWQDRLLTLSAQVEAVLDMSDEGEVGESLAVSWHDSLEALVDEFAQALALPAAERLRDGVRIVIAGPPNSGKSSLLNVLAGREAAIISSVAGTTRDVIEAPTLIGGVPFVLADTAGLRDSQDEVEAIGVARARERVAGADIVIWLGDPAERPSASDIIRVESKSDLRPLDTRRRDVDLHVSATSGEGIEALTDRLVDQAKTLLPREGEAVLNARHRALVEMCREALAEAKAEADPLIIAESLRNALGALDRITGRAGVEDMLDRLFSSLCIGK